MEKLVIFNDYANINAAFQQQGLEADNLDLLRYLSDGRFLVEAHAFVPIDPRNPTGRDRTIENLWQQGYLVHSKVGILAGDTYRCDFDVELTLELMRTAELVRPDIVVLMSGDKDFIPVVIELRRRGIRVEIAAFPAVNAAREMVLKGSGFIDLHRYLSEHDDHELDQIMIGHYREHYEDFADPEGAPAPAPEAERETPTGTVPSPSQVSTPWASDDRPGY
jgi:uncharacterized LabA/DUF88 family protein